MKKNCPHCQNSTIQKHCKKNNTQRYKCLSCNKTFSLTKKLNPHQIWFDYKERKQTYNQLAIQYHYSVRTIQRYILRAEKAKLKSPIKSKLNIIADTIFLDVILACLLTGFLSEKDVYYKIAINQLREKRYIVDKD